MSKVILSEESLFIETEVTGDGANETAIEDAAGELSPVFVFEGFEEPGSDAGALGDFLQCDLAELALALETFPEISLGHAFYLRTSVAATQLQANTLVVKGAGFRGEPEAACVACERHEGGERDSVRAEKVGRQDGKMATPVPRAGCVGFSEAPILTKIGKCGCRNSEAGRESGRRVS
jgi:hypothetical protein